MITSATFGRNNSLSGFLLHEEQVQCIIAQKNWQILAIVAFLENFWHPIKLGISKQYFPSMLVAAPDANNASTIISSFHVRHRRNDEPQEIQPKLLCCLLIAVDTNNTSTRTGYQSNHRQDHSPLVLHSHLHFCSSKSMIHFIHAKTSSFRSVDST